MGSIGAFIKLIAGFFAGLGKAEDKKTGAMQAELAGRKKADEQRKKAKKVRADNPKRSKRQHLDRM